jgi:hypothetical protein
MHSFDQRNENKALIDDVGFECGDGFRNASLEIAFGGCQIGHAHILEFAF